MPNFLLSNNFVFEITRAPEISWFVSSVEIPSISLSSINTQYPLIDKKIPGDKIEYEPLVVNIKLDEDLKTYAEVYDWMKNIGLGNGWFKDGEIKSDIIVAIGDSNKKSINFFQFIDCWPSDISNISLEYSNSASEPIDFSVTFQYTKFDVYFKGHNFG